VLVEVEALARRLTWTVVRWIPLVTAAYGMQMARPARTTMLAPDGDGFQLDRRVRPALGDSPPRGQEPGGVRGSWVPEEEGFEPGFMRRCSPWLERCKAW
jgi:hypothetical protein